MHILIICHANTCRSVMAEALLVRMLRERSAPPHFSVASAGVAPYARDGALVSMDARLALRDIGISQAPKQVSTDLKRNRHMVAAADLILAMTGDQIRLLREGFPEAEGKRVVTLKELAGLAGDIDDPAGHGNDVYRSCRDEIQMCLERAIEALL